MHPVSPPQPPRNPSPAPQAHTEPVPPAASASTAAVGHVALRLPTFWASNPQVWFLQVECQFALAGVTSQLTRYRHVVSVLPQEVAAEIIDILSAPPTTTPYDTLKTAVLERTMTSERRRIQQLLSAEEIGDRRPSQFLRHMQALLGDRASATDPTLMRQLFLHKLPVHVQMILASDTSSALPELAAQADRIMEVATPTISATAGPSPASAPCTNHSSTSPPSVVHPDPLARLQADVDRLSSLVAAALSPRPAHPRSHARRRSRSRAHPRSGSPAAANDVPPDGVCWYHQRFGQAARRCTRPCTWPGNATGDR